MSIIIPSKNIYFSNNNKIRKTIISSTDAEIYHIDKKSNAQVSFSSHLFSEETTKAVLGLVDYLKFVPMYSNPYNVESNWNYGEDWGVGTQYQRKFLIEYDGTNYLNFNSSKIRFSLEYKKGKRYQTTDTPFAFSKNEISDLMEFTLESKINEEFISLEVVNLGIPIPLNIKCKIIPNETKKGFVSELYVPWFGWKEDTNEAVAFISLDVEIISDEYDETKEKVTFGEGNHNFSVSTNEFFQYGSIYNGKNLFEYVSNKVINSYKDGKETAVIRCSVPEDLSVFEIGDEVIPMVYGADGADRPMSRYKDGTQKVFNVVGTKFIYDGAVWQELTLQEKTQSV